MAFDPARVKSLFLGASDLPSPEERAAYLDRGCGDEPDLRARVEALLAAEDRAGPVPLPQSEAIGVLQPTPAEAIGATQMVAPETLSESRVSDLDACPATVAATGAGGGDGTLAGAPDVARTGGFVPGRVIGGRYTLLEVLGEGGMGTVYHAEQSQPVRRMVALKLIKIGMDSRTVLARFDAERQALAMMDHPNIARVYDGGATDANQPFFVMEFVRGVPITDYCDHHRLSVDARLQLFVAVCQAVQHAHQKGIIHRDLKPSNVMVAEVDGRPTPKVIDFGVAKATEASLTDQSLGDTGAIVGTPTYMSPEQADPSSMDIDTRTDVYALGVILYELLAGSTPLDATQFRRGALLEMLRMVREVDPSKPSTKVSTSEGLPSIAANRGIDPGQLKRALSGDLDWIVMKALEKDRTRRYETANGFASDILRHLASEPVQAAPPSRSYRTRKFVRKHRAGVVAAGLVLLALVAGVAGTTWGLVEARRSARAERLAKLDAQDKKLLAEANEKKALAAAEEERKAKETVEDVLGFVEGKVFAAARPRGQDGGLGYDVTLADAITAALPAIEAGFAGKPQVEARLRNTIGISFLCLGKSAFAERQFEAALSLNRMHLGPDHQSTLTSMSYLATCYRGLGRFAEALKLREETLALRKARLGPDHADTILSMIDLAHSYSDLDRHAEALRLREELLPLARVKLGPDHPYTLVGMNNLANSYTVVGRHAEALKLREEALVLQRAKLGPDHPDTIWTMDGLATSYSAFGRNAEALKLYGEALALRKVRLGPEHAHTLTSMHYVAYGYTILGRHAEAAKLREEALAIQRAKLGPDHPDTLMVMAALAHNYNALGRHAEAIKLREEAEALKKGKPGPDRPGRDNLAEVESKARGLWQSGVSAFQEGRFQDAAVDLREASERFGALRTSRPNDPTLVRLHATCLGFLAGSLRDSKCPGEALARFRESLAAYESLANPNPGDLYNMACDCAMVAALDERGSPEDREKLQARAVVYLRRAIAGDMTLFLPQVATDRDLDPLRRRADFKGVIADARFPIDPFVQSSPLALPMATPGELKIRGEALIAQGRTLEALPLLEKSSASNSQDMLASLRIAALRAWLGQGEEVAAIRRRALALARGTDDVVLAERVAKLGSILPAPDRADLDAALALGRLAAKPGDEAPYRPYRLLALGMAAYRAGDDPACDAALLAAGEAGKAIPVVTGTSAFYRAMSLHRRGRLDEARKLATEAAATMKPLPADAQNPLAGGASHDDLILWLAYKEARALIGFDPPPAAPAKPDGN